MDILEILGRIGFDWQVALANLFNFLLIYLILKRYAFKPIQKIIEKRRSSINSGLDQAQAAETELMMAKQKADTIVSEAKQEANQLVSRAKERGDILIQEAEANAKRERERIVAAGSKQIEQERSEAEVELRKQAASLVVSGVKTILGDTITTEQDKRLTEEAIAATKS